MKKIFVILTCFLALFTTGCLKYSYNIEIDNKDNVSISEIGAVNQNLMKAFNPNFSEEMRSKLEEDKGKAEQEGYKAEIYDDGTFIGFKHTKEYQISDYNTKDLPKGFTTTQKTPIEIKKGFFKNKYSIALKYDIKSASSGNNGMQNFGNMQNQNGYTPSNSMFQDEDEDKIISRVENTNPATGEVTETVTYEDGTVSTTSYNKQDMNNFENSMNSMMNSSKDLKPVADLTIKIPKKAKEHNAQEETKDYEYKWNLATNEPFEVKLTYEKTNVLNIVLLLGFITIILLLLFASGNITNKRM